MDAELGEIYNFLPISDKLSSGGMPTEDQLKLLQEAGYAVVIDLALPNQANALAHEADIVTKLGMEYISIPVVFSNPTPEDLTRTMDALDAHAEQKVFVHCMANYRVAAFLYLYRVLRLGVSPTDAEAQLLHVWQPNEAWATFIRNELARH